MIKKAKDADIYTPEDIQKIKARIQEVNGIPIKEIGITTLIGTIEQLEQENKRLEKFIENLQDVHEVEKARFRAEIQQLENEIQDLYKTW
ncbi:hypothetical protein [Priestia flexa]|uniref:Uncharacterized protein n=1 Tax=Priestia flexa TaxID=86664 RepID=A0A8I1MCL2_9BACI|nr:hypothetical protein [Priestia flexa]MBN8249976.1 hypothetical protein [Priestia flexa]